MTRSYHYAQRQIRINISIQKCTYKCYMIRCVRIRIQNTQYNIQLMSVKVGVRVRPFNQREKDLNCKLCVDMMGPTTRLFDADDPEKHRDFTFDYSFWSHDQFHTDERGYFVGDTDKYADQQHVFEQVGLQILSNAWEGYHCCLFAYGQTGAGKSYSMVGYGANKGIVPISCEQIFKRIQKNDDKNKQYQVSVSMLQIYNERVQDLLIPISKRSKQGFKIRQNKSHGIYVEGLSKHFVDTYQSIENKMEEGGKNRSIAATQMNASSSRAHTIISIQFKQRQSLQGKKRQKLSVIHLVDLAGSQKVGKTGATGDRLKQAAGINKSLSVLGLVISTLADKAMGKGKGTVVPYRDSCLTRILQNALGGNSKTLMICAISPATDNYQQTLSTLRYADQAKKIQNKAVINESQTDKIIRNLTAQKQQLREKVAKFEQMFKKLQMGLGIDAGSLQQFNDAKEQLRFNTMLMNDMTMSKKQKLQIQHNEQIITDVSHVDKSKPHISNLNQDPQLSRKINYSIDTEETKVGKRNSEPQNDIQIGGMGIRNLHAIISKDEQGQIYIEPIFQGEDSGCYLNGDTVTEKTQIMNYDRLAFGANNMFIVIIPETQPRNKDVDVTTIDWEYAQNQLYLRKELLQKEQMEQVERKIKQETQQILRKKQQQLEQLQRKLKQNEQQRKHIEQQKQIEKAEMEKKLKEQQAERLKLQIEKGKKKMLDRQSQQKQRIKQKYYFEKKLLKTLPKCIQLNLIAKQFKRNISMSVKMLLPNQKQDDQEQDIDLKRRSIKIKVVNRQVGYTYWWDVEKLQNRYYIIKDMSETYFQTGVIPQLSQKEDPFWDPPEHVLIGRAFLTTKALSYLFDNLTTLSIIGQEDHCGQITVNMIPTDETGQRNLCQEMDEEQVQFQPEELMDKPFYYNVVIEEATIPDHHQNIYVQYSVKIDEKKSQTFRTQQIAQKTRNPVWNYRKLHKFDKINDILLNYLSTARIVFKIYAYQLVTKQKKQQQITQPSQVAKEVTRKNSQRGPSQMTQASTPVKQVQQVPNTQPNQPQKIAEPAIKSGRIQMSTGFTSSNQKPMAATTTSNTSAQQQQKPVSSMEPPAGKKKKKEKQDCMIF